MADGCLGMMALGAKEVTGGDKFKLGKAYTLRKLADLEALGVTSENNPNLYRNVKEFYAEAGDGTELWLTGYAESETFANAFDKDNAAGAVALLKASNGKIRGLVAFKTPAEAYELTTTEGLDADVFAALPKAQQLGDWATDTLRAPIFSLVEGYGYAGEKVPPRAAAGNHDVQGGTRGRGFSHNLTSMERSSLRVISQLGCAPVENL